MEDQRPRPRPALNGEDEIADALDLASAARTERAAIAVLTGLSGVDTPVASAVMTAGPPERYAFIDFRPVWSLGVERVPYHSVVYYLRYLKACRSIPRHGGDVSAHARPGAVEILQRHQPSRG